MRTLVRNSLFIFIIISLLFHFGVWTGLRLSANPNWFRRSSDKVEFVILDQSQVKALTEKPKQVVEQPDKALNDEIDEKAKYLSAHNQRVVHETKAQKSGDFQNSAGKGEQKSTQQKTARTEPQKPTKQSHVKKFADRKDDFKSGLPTLSDLSPRFDPTQKPTDDTVSNGDGQKVSQTNDFLKETPPSLETVLATREFVYYTYFQRIRNQIRQYWEPSIREKVRHIFASGRTIASERDHITRVIVVLDQTGNLLKVQVIGESGVKDLDDAATEAFRAAAPFPNPPKGMVDKDGTIKVPWDFVIEAGMGVQQFQHDYPPAQNQRFARR